MGEMAPLISQCTLLWEMAQFPVHMGICITGKDIWTLFCLDALFHEIIMENIFSLCVYVCYLQDDLFGSQRKVTVH